ncbi:MAG: nucleotidyltransferase domain-containing protein [Candidatus Baldrarchaeia archaeon]
MVDHLINVCRVLSKKGMRYAVVGGIAAILLGVQRTTLDIDILLEVEDANALMEVVDELTSAGYTIDKNDVMVAFEERSHFTVLLEGGRFIDFKIASSDIDISTIRRRRFINIRGEEIAISPLEELIATKLRILGSQKDVEDALHLMYLHIDKIDWEYLRNLLNVDVFEYINDLIARIEQEFKEDAYILRKMRGLKKLKGKIEECLGKS